LEKFDGKHLVSRLTAETILWNSGYNWTIHNYLKRDFDGMYEHITHGESMDTVIMIQPNEFFITAKEAPQMTNPQLKAHLEKQSRRGIGSIQVFEDEYYKRFSIPISAFIMTLMGVSLSSRKVRGGMGLNLGIGLALSALYILFSTISTSFSVNRTMSAAMAVWLPNIVFLIVGIFLYFRAPK
jgi:lipopolysaccharide export system permease protein